MIKNLLLQHRYLSVLFALFICLFEGAFAQMASPPDESKKLDLFLGKWMGNCTYTEGEKKSTFKLTSRCTKIASGWGVQINQSAHSPEMGKYEDANLLSYNPEDKKYHMFSVTNAGDIHDHSGDWVKDKKNVLFLRFEGTMNSKPVVEELTIMVESPRKIHYRDVYVINGGDGPVYEATLNKE